MNYIVRFEHTEKGIFEILRNKYREDWLLSLEIYELISRKNSEFSEKVLQHLNDLQTRKPKIAHLIQTGLSLLKK